MTIRVLLADDHPIVLDGLKLLLDMDEGIEVVGTCMSGDELLERFEAAAPDVVIFDQRMPRMTGLEVLQALVDRGSTTAAVLLAANLSDKEVLEALRLGIQGIVLKEHASDTIRSCVRQVHQGGRWWPPELMQRALDTTLRGEVERRRLTEDLTPRELEIVQHVAAGHSNKRIARLLSISEGTVKTHLHSCFKKLGAANRVQLTLYAQEEGLVIRDDVE